MRPLFTLGPRLALCADLVRPGSALCDVGTDHAYLPIWLLKQGKIPRALACDVNPGPLEAARRDGEKYQVGEGLTLRLSDGLCQVAPQEAEDVVIAGMGGELILRIVEETPWLQEGEKRLILQPMSSVPELREGLKRLGFEVLEEHAVQDSGKVYSAFAAQYRGAPLETSPLYLLMGKLAPGEPHVDTYARKVLRELAAQRKGALHREDTSRAEMLEGWIRQIQAAYLEETSF
ncbi:MAG: class I SAM-dependent methyltransferase [Acutalibacter sp.]|jgi:tRNA (adenine22-N1)-methyltransferase